MEENLHGKGAYLWKQQVQTESFIYFTLAMRLKKKKRPYWTYWFLVWHQTHQPEDRWPVRETDSGLCGWLWMTSVSGSPQSRCQSVTPWICHLWGRKYPGSLAKCIKNRKQKCSFLYGCTLVVSLPTVSMVSLSSIRSWALGMSMCMRSVCCCLFIGSVGRVFLLGNTHNRKWPQLFKQKKQPTICLLRYEGLLTSWASQPNFLHLEHQVRKHWLVCWRVQRLKLVRSDDLSSHLWASWASAPSSSSSAPAARWRSQRCPPAHRKLSPSSSNLRHHRSCPCSRWVLSPVEQWCLCRSGDMCCYTIAQPWTRQRPTVSEKNHLMSLNISYWMWVITQDNSC